MFWARYSSGVFRIGASVIVECQAPRASLRRRRRCISERSVRARRAYIRPRPCCYARRRRRPTILLRAHHCRLARRYDRLQFLGLSSALAPSSLIIPFNVYCLIRRFKRRGSILFARNSHLAHWHIGLTSGLQTPGGSVLGTALRNQYSPADSPDGQFPHVRHAKIARRANLSQVSELAPSGKSKPSSRASRLDEEGRFGRSSRYVGRGCGGRCGHVRRTWPEADGEVVWFWRSEAGAKVAGSVLRTTVATKQRSPGRARYKP